MPSCSCTDPSGVYNVRILAAHGNAPSWRPQSGEADLVHRFELLATVVREDHFERALALRAERESEERVIAQRRGEREVADPLARILDLHLFEVERSGLEIDLSLADCAAPPVGVPDLDLRVHDLTAA